MMGFKCNSGLESNTSAAPMQQKAGLRAWVSQLPQALNYHSTFPPSPRGPGESNGLTAEPGEHKACSARWRRLLFMVPGNRSLSDLPS